MSEATDKLTAALSKLASDGATKQKAHADHNVANLTFDESLKAATDAIAAVTLEVQAIAADSEKPANASAFPTPPVSVPQP